MYFKFTKHDAINVVGGIMIGYGLASWRMPKIVEIPAEQDTVDIFVMDGLPLLKPNYNPEQFYCNN